MEAYDGERAPDGAAHQRGKGRAMIKVGDRIPDAVLKRVIEGKVQDVTTKELFSGRKVVLFAVPGAFTPLCSERHLPSFIDRADEIHSRGVDAIVCIAVNDAFVMDAWARERGAGERVQLLADGNGDLTRAMGLDIDASGFGMGLRSQRYAAIVDDGIVTELRVEKPMKYEVSSAEAILDLL